MFISLQISEAMDNQLTKNSLLSGVQGTVSNMSRPDVNNIGMDRPRTGETVSTQFRENMRTMYNNEAWNASQALDIYIDSARHLPDNCSVVKMTAKVVDSTFADLTEPTIELADPGVSSLRN